MLETLIPAGLKIAEGFLNRSAAKDANEKAAAERAADRQAQFDYATKGIQWKAADARKAGLHPLFAMGASTTSFSPLAIGTPQSEGMGSALSDAGQDISRAISATSTNTGRATAYTEAAQKLSLENASLQNQKLASEIAKLNANANPAPPSVNQRYLVEGQGSTALTDLIKDKPMERTPSDPLTPSSEPGAIPDVGYARTQTGHAPVPSKDVKERIEDSFLQELMWAVRNQLLPSLGRNLTPPSTSAGKDRYWAYDPAMQEYRAARGMKRTMFGRSPIFD